MNNPLLFHFNNSLKIPARAFLAKEKQWEKTKITIIKNKNSSYHNIKRIIRKCWKQLYSEFDNGNKMDIPLEISRLTQEEIENLEIS